MRYEPNPRGRPGSNSSEKAIFVILVLFGIVFLALRSKPDAPVNDESSSTQASDYLESEEFTAGVTALKEEEGRSHWVTISYEGLVNTSVLTHNGETVGQVVKNIATTRRYPGRSALSLSQSLFGPDPAASLKGLVQPYLEPFSVLCHDVLLATAGPDSIPLVNVVSHYPVGGEQPAWVALAREGRLQVYYNRERIRVFLAGRYASVALSLHNKVVCHPLRDIMNTPGINTQSIEVYVFENDYRKMEIRLNTTPAIYEPSELNLGPRGRPLDLDGLERFIERGVQLEAIEVDETDNLYLYGTESSDQTLAGVPQSLSDLAVVYRAFFHCGDNDPYISLDAHEDNRYAKVNFGGLLEDTRVGSVTLEADKRFKTLSTGLDVNTRESITDRYRRAIPEFLTEDERSLLDSGLTTRVVRLRYWFYPDSISTVTDGSIGAVTACQFQADVERMDEQVAVGSSVRNTIAHLNGNYDRYCRADPTFRELKTTGRLMALMNWLKAEEMDTRAELSDLLSVALPAVATARATPRILAATRLVYGTSVELDASSVSEHAVTRDLSRLVATASPTTSHDDFLGLAQNQCEDIDAPELGSSGYREAKRDLEFYRRRIDAGGSSHDVSRYNSTVNRLNAERMFTQCLVSIGGGIDLGPKQFRRTIRRPESPKIIEVRRARSALEGALDGARSGAWTRSTSNPGEARTNPLPGMERTDGTSSVTSRIASPVTHARIEENGGWKVTSKIANHQDETTYSPATQTLKAVHPGLGIAGKAKTARERVSAFDEDGRMVSKETDRFVFTR